MSSCPAPPRPNESFQVPSMHFRQKLALELENLFCRGGHWLGPSAPAQKHCAALGISASGDKGMGILSFTSLSWCN